MKLYYLIFIIFIIFILFILFIIIYRNKIENFDIRSYECDYFYKNEIECNKNYKCKWINDTCHTKCIDYNNIEPHQLKVKTCKEDKNCIWDAPLYYNKCMLKEPIQSIIYEFPKYQ
jgi:hypothetical protein